MNRLLAASAAALLVAATPACASSREISAPISGAPGGKLVVFAAVSLKKAFTQIGDQFGKDNPGTSVEFSFGGSSDLVTQLTQGAYADVFASADTKNMQRASTAGLLADQPVNFASNTLTIAVAPGNPKGINAFRDLTKPGVSVVVCASQVPCGSATQKVETATGVNLNPVSEESSVTDVLGKVTSGQADAGLVYVTDTAGAGEKVTAVAFSEARDAVNTYPIATLKQAESPTLADKFVDVVTGPTGQEVLAKAGFGTP